MHLGDDVDLVFSLRGGIGYLVDDLTDIVHTVVGSRIDHKRRCSPSEEKIKRKTGKEGLSVCGI